MVQSPSLIGDSGWSQNFFISALYSTALPLPRPADWPSLKIESLRLIGKIKVHETKFLW
jgi:hypothetical protein